MTHAPRSNPCKTNYALIAEGLEGGRDIQVIIFPTACCYLITEYRVISHGTVHTADCKQDTSVPRRPD